MKLRRAASCLVFLLAASGPSASRAAVDPSGLGLGADLRARLSTAAADPTLEPWKRDVMLELAHAPRSDVQQTTVADGTWQSYFPEKRMTHSAIYDPVRHRMIIFGGQDDHGYSNDTWALTLTGTPTWTPLATSGTLPPARMGHSAIYDAVRDRMVIYGGWDGTLRYRDVWALALGGSMTWSDVTPPGGILTGPTPRYYHTATYDPVRDRMLVLGGYDTAYEGDLWALTFSTNSWSQLSPAGTPPGGLVNHTTIYDPLRDRMVTFGGWDGVNRHNAVWALTLAGTPTWSLVAAGGTPPNPNVGSRGVYDPVRDRFVIFGGYDGSYENAVWAMTLAGSPTWSLVSTGGTPPPGSAEQSVIYEPGGDRLVTFDGTDGPDGLIYHLLDDTESLPLAGSPTWSELPPGPNAPAARMYSSAIYDVPGKRTVMFGGTAAYDFNSPAYLGGVRAFSLTGSPGWSDLAPAGTPPAARAGHAAIYDPLRNRMLVFGGRSDLSFFNDVWALSLSGTPTWTQIVPTGTPPSARTFSTSVYDSKRDRMLVFGGYLGINYYNEVWELSLAGTPAWTMLTPTGTPPSGRYFHVAIYDPPRDRMVVYGGYNSSGYLTDLWALNLASGPVWSALTQVGSAFPQSGYSAIYDPVRVRMLMFGGYYSSSSYNFVLTLTLAGTPTWGSLAPTGIPPSGRYAQAVAYDGNTDRMMVLAGTDGYPRNDVWSLYWGTPLLDAKPVPPVTRLSLAAPWPNPTRAASTIEFEIPTAARVRLAIFDLAGREVRRIENAQFSPGRYSRSWDGVDAAGNAAPSGIYFVRLEVPGASLHAKVVRLR